MPGRQGYTTSTGSWSQNGTSSLTAILDVTGRANNTPSEYKATQEINFVEGFQSDEGDEFEAFITEDDGSGGSSGPGGDMAGGYRYGFNGKENDNDIKGVGTQYDYGFRIYDPRVSRFLSVDPLIDKFPELTPYQFSSNSPISNIDLDGQESYWYQFDLDKKSGEVSVKLAAVKKSWLDWITPSHLVVKIGDHDWVYDADYSKSSGALDEQVQKIKADPEAYYIEMQKRHGTHDEYVAKRKTEDKEMQDMMWALAFGMKFVQSKVAATTVSTEEQAIASNNRVATNGAKKTTGASNTAAVTKTNSQKAGALSNLGASAGNSPKSLLKASTTNEQFVEHHIFNVFRGSSPTSQKYRDFFKNLKINVNDHAVKIPESLHKFLHREGGNWTTQWKKWIDANPNATLKDVYQQAGRMMDEAGINNQPIKKYKK